MCINVEKGLIFVHNHISSKLQKTFFTSTNMSNNNVEAFVPPGAPFEEPVVCVTCSGMPCKWLDSRDKILDKILSMFLCHTNGVITNINNNPVSNEHICKVMYKIYTCN